MAQTKPSRDVEQATAEAPLVDGTTKPQQQKEVKAGAKTPELGKSDSARKRAHQAAEAAEEALKKVAELKDAVAEVVNGEGDGGKNVEDKVAGDKAANGEHEDAASKKSSKLHPEQSPGNAAVAATNGGSHTAEEGQEERGATTNGDAAPEQVKQNGSHQQEGVVPTVGEDTVNLGNPSLNPSQGQAFSGDLDLNQSLQSSTLAGAAQEALKAVEQAVGASAAGAGAPRTTPVSNGPQGAAPMQEG